MISISTRQLLLIVLLGFAKVTFASDPLAEGFANPPRDARPQVWWHWMYGNITEYGITKDLEQLQALGIAGVTQFHNAWLRKPATRVTPKGPVRFMSQEYQDLIQHTLDECERLGLTLGLQICDGFSQTGGPWVNAENAMRRVKYVVHRVAGGTEHTMELPSKTIRVLAYPGSLKVEDSDKKKKGKQKRSLPIINPHNPYVTKQGAQTAPIELGEFVDISDLAQGNKIKWTPPSGDWVVLAFYDALHPKKNHPASPEGTGFEANKLNREAIDLVFDNYVGKLIEQAGDRAGSTLKHVLIDSWECGYQSWTAGFAEEFEKRRGYDPTPYLPVLAKIPVNSIEESNRFLTDFRVTLDDLVIEEYYTHVRDRLHEHGMELHAEVLYGWHQMFGSPIRQYGVIDVPMNEVWMTDQFAGNKGKNIHGRIYTGYAATAGHVYGKPIIKDEAFTIGAGKGDFSYTPAMIKPKADYAWIRGTNRFVMHTSTHQPGDEKPGWTHSLNGMNFHRGNTWWPYARSLIDYLSRGSFLMQQGVFAADVIRYVGHEDTYSEGYLELPLKGLPLGYRADHCDNTVVLERMDVKDGRIVLPNGASYAVLLLADKQEMSPRILEKLAEFVEKGATIVGPKPIRAPGLTNYPQSDAEVKRLADSLWDSGKIRDISIKQALEELKLQPDFTYTAPQRKSMINFVHRILPDGEIYFIATAGEGALIDCSFRVHGMYPQFFDPSTGDMTDITEFEERDGRTHISIELEDQGSRFVVFRKKPAGLPHMAMSEQTVIPLSGSWEVSFEAGRGAPESITMSELASLSEHSDFGVRHFSGEATYRRVFDYPDSPAGRVFLDLGDVGDVALVSLNGKSVGSMWRAPFKIEITEQLRSGTNELEVTVVNTWVNRLIGDKKVPEAEWVCDIVPANPPWFKPKSQLLPSGLIGPVSLLK
ncbi:MAG: glycosyl hydrolase [Opitutales bacterium]